MNKIDYEDAGLEFVNGDRFSGGTGIPCTVDYFAWRTNTGVRPEFRGLIDWERDDGDIFTGVEIVDLCWASNIARWRPHLPQIQTETPEEKVVLDKIDAHISDHSNPIYTQAMCDAGELPMVGSSVVLRYRRDIKSVVHSGTVKYASSRHCILDNGTCEVCLLMVDYEFRPIQTEREKAIDDAMQVISRAIDLNLQEKSVQDLVFDLVCEIHDAGLLK